MLSQEEYAKTEADLTKEGQRALDSGMGRAGVEGRGGVYFSIASFSFLIHLLSIPLSHQMKNEKDQKKIKW